MKSQRMWKNLMWVLECTLPGEDQLPGEFEFVADTPPTSVTCDPWSSGLGKYRCNTIDTDVSCTTNPDTHVAIGYCNSKDQPVQLQCIGKRFGKLRVKTSPEILCTPAPNQILCHSIIGDPFLFCRVQSRWDILWKKKLWDRTIECTLPTSLGTEYTELDSSDVSCDYKEDIDTYLCNSIHNHIECTHDSGIHIDAECDAEGKDVQLTTQCPGKETKFLPHLNYFL